METPTPKKDWFSRNWKWFIPVVLLVIGLCCVVCVGGGFYSIFGLIKSNYVYQHGLEMVQVNTRAQQLLGTPINAGFLVSGNVEESGSTGSADLSFPVSGPKGSGTVHAKGTKYGGSWVITSLVLVMDGTGERVVVYGSE
jgi:hypothetical protein